MLEATAAGHKCVEKIITLKYSYFYTSIGWIEFWSLACTSFTTDMSFKCYNFLSSNIKCIYDAWLSNERNKKTETTKQALVI